MSSYDVGKNAGRQAQSIDLTDGEKALMEKLFANPSLWPDSAKVWIADYVSQNSLLPISQVQGFTQFVAQQDVVTANESTSSSTYVDLTTTGPELTGISPGQYLVMFGAAIAGASDTDGLASVSFNGAACDDDDGIHAGSPSGDILSISAARVLVHTFTESTNTIKMQYRRELGAGSVTFWQRWLVLLRIGNP